MVIEGRLEIFFKKWRISHCDAENNSHLHTIYLQMKEFQAGKRSEGGLKKARETGSIPKRKTKI